MQNIRPAGTPFSHIVKSKVKAGENGARSLKEVSATIPTYERGIQHESF